MQVCFTFFLTVEKQVTEGEKGLFFWNFLFWPGHYVPQLAQLIVQSKVKFNLKGVAVSRKELKIKK